MDGALKLWKCKNGHCLGIVMREEATSTTDSKKYHITRLWLFREAVEGLSSSYIGDLDKEVIAKVQGTAEDIRCSCCGEVRTWWIGEAALERIVGKSRLPEAQA